MSNTEKKVILFKGCRVSIDTSFDVIGIAGVIHIFSRKPIAIKLFEYFLDSSCLNMSFNRILIIIIHQHVATKENFKAVMRKTHTKIGEAVIYKAVPIDRRLNANRPGF